MSNPPAFLRVARTLAFVGSLSSQTAACVGIARADNPPMPNENCPGAEPAAGSQCVTINVPARCYYGSPAAGRVRACGCTAGSEAPRGTWSCADAPTPRVSSTGASDNAAACPRAMPAQGDRCSAPGATYCRYSVANTPPLQCECYQPPGAAQSAWRCNMLRLPVGPLPPPEGPAFTA